MKYKILTSLCLSTILACGADIGIAQEKTQNDTYNDMQGPSEVDSAEEIESQEDVVEEEVIEEEEDTAIPEEPENQIVDFSQWGPHYPYGIAKETRIAAVNDCSNMEYKVYTPYADNPPVVVLGHGFARGADVMVGWAEHLSSWGVEVLLPTLCHYNVFTGVDHEMNGQNMKELAILHGATDVVYVGHSAGGLAAIIAASQDPNASGVLGLDATDTQDVPGVPDFIGQNYASNVTIPAFSVFGEPSSCNSSNNGLELFKMIANYRAIQVTSADHCDFENPTDFVCELSCEASAPEYSDDELRPVITALGTAAILSMHGSLDGDFVWSEQGLNNWLTSGIIQEK